ncbi:MAG TPA: HAMP domain-containing sensor histidine kinase, partial [Campylobacterales bacterium]|nr:HAMP domain-containing sensor histidine kinase [Campylobacterales bacterium]
RLYPDEKGEEVNKILGIVSSGCKLSCGCVGREGCDHPSSNRGQREFTYTTKNGNTIETLLSVASFKNRELQTNFILSITDISAIKELERKQKESEKLLLAQSRMADMGEMIGAIAHQWRQPLNTLGLLVQDVPYCVKNNEMSIEYANEFNKSAMEQISFMSNTIDDFRNFFKIDKQLVSFSLAEQVRNTLSLVVDMYKTHSINIITLEKSAPIVTGYPNELSQAILNIVSNSKDAFEELNTKQRRIVVTISETEKFGKLTIEDSAGGISKEVIDRIFEPYFTTKPEGKGTGIGLYMSKTIVETNMKGRLTVHNKDDGAVFTIKIPLLH